MISKKQLQYYSSLLTKKYREIENKFIAEGKRLVLEGLTSNYKCEAVFITNKFAKENKEIVNQFDTLNHESIFLNQKEFEKISDTKTPQGIAAVFLKPLPEYSVNHFSNDKIIVMLDNISDPGNLGTIIRNCDWFGVKNILLSENIVEYTNPKVIRSSMGSVFHLKLFECVTADSILKLKESGFEVLCADLEGENIFTFRSENKKLLILSSESHGPSREFEKLSDKKITIPRIGKAESLNVASASAVLLAQLIK